MDIMWAYRRTLRNGIAVAAVIVTALFGVLWFTTPTDLFGTVHFRVLFDGADQGEYPNGTPFSSAEIVATPVLEQVFAANDLQRYHGFQRIQGDRCSRSSRTRGWSSCRTSIRPSWAIPS